MMENVLKNMSLWMIVFGSIGSIFREIGFHVAGEQFACVFDT
jgi:hypothetical protein